MEWKKCLNIDCTNEKAGGNADIDADKPYTYCFTCNKSAKNRKSQPEDEGPKAIVSEEKIEDSRTLMPGVKESVMGATKIKTFVCNSVDELDEKVNAFGVNHNVFATHTDWKLICSPDIPGGLVERHKAVLFFK